MKIAKTKCFSFTLLLSVGLVSHVMAQTAQIARLDPSSQKKPWQTVQKTDDQLESGIFRSTSGGFSLAIPEMPFETREYASETAKAKGIDAGKLYLWKFGKTIYTAFYSPPFGKDGDPLPENFASMESGTRRGIVNRRGKLISEQPIKFGAFEGTEFRYASAEGVQFISRLYLIGDVGYQIVGAYREGEKEILKVLDSFKLLENSCVNCLD